jgi:hypothetical protein
VLPIVSLLLTCDGPPALCGLQNVSVRGGSARRDGRVVAGPVCGVVAESRAESVCGAASYARIYFRCTVQGETALIRAVNNGEEAQLKQLIDAKANPDAKDVIYRSCARVSLSECSELAAPDITLIIL